MALASIDIGSNSVLLLVAERQKTGDLLDIEERMEVTRLSDGIGAGGELGELPIERTADAVVAFVNRARELGAKDVIARGTAGLRNATNAGRFIERVRARCGVTIQVISGDEEARCAYLAGRGTAPNAAQRIAVVDIGGASTEFTFGRGPEMDTRMSLPIGAVRLTEAFFRKDPVADAEVETLLAHLREVLAKPMAEGPVDAVIGIAGTFTDLAAAHLGLEKYDPLRIEGAALDADALDRLVERLQRSTIAERRQIRGLHPKRADVILAGALIAREVPRALGRREVRISRRGLRHGLLL